MGRSEQSERERERERVRKKQFAGRVVSRDKELKAAKDYRSILSMGIEKHIRRASRGGSSPL